MIKRHSFKQLSQVIKRDGRLAPFNRLKIVEAIRKAAEAGGGEEEHVISQLTDAIVFHLAECYPEGAPEIESIQDAVERVLMQTGSVQTARAYVLYREKRGHLRNTLKVRRDSAHISFIQDVFSLTESLPESWDRKRIVSDLAEEFKMSIKLADEIARSVEERVMAMGFAYVSTGLLRELIEHELFDHGVEAKIKAGSRIGMLVKDVKHQLSRALTIPYASGLYDQVAVTSLKQYMLQHVFSREVVQYHRQGIMHIDHLGQCFFESGTVDLENLKITGLVQGDKDLTAPANYARTLSGQLGAFLREHAIFYASHLEVRELNVLFAPYLEGMSYEQMKQEMQHLLYSSWQGSTVVRQDFYKIFHISVSCPKDLFSKDAIGPGGVLTGKSYGDYSDTIELMAMALVDVCGEETSTSLEDGFPLCRISVKAADLSGVARIEILRVAIALAMHNPHMDLQCVDGLVCVEKPLIQSVTLNCPQIVFRVLYLREENLYLLLSQSVNVALQSLEDKSIMINLKESRVCLKFYGLNLCLSLLQNKELIYEGSAEECLHRILSYARESVDRFEKRTGLEVVFDLCVNPEVENHFMVASQNQFPELETMMQRSDDFGLCSQNMLSEKVLLDHEQLKVWIDLLISHHISFRLSLAFSQRMYAPEDILEAMTLICASLDTSVAKEEDLLFYV